MKRRAFIIVLALGLQPLCASVADAQQPADAQAAHPYALHVADAARRFGIPERWIWAVMRVESRGNSRVISPAGAMGLMQIMPGTWANLRTRHGLGSDPFDVRGNIMAGAAYLRAMYDRYGNATAMLAAYNAGPGRYDEHLSRGRPLPAETRGYLAKLAPMVGGADDVQLAVATSPDPFSWRRASLFAARATNSPAAPDAALDERPADVRAAVQPTANGLFVALSAQRQP
ncbi:lytic transglycosylase [Sphingobium jiangsuense]|uniref:Transglycosylase SLT domain-containing protein n=1 Tax=Sphingobium jiangsuense TaxID=870476 RepID=A0A7W6FPZ3_9SPHN|nr:lytic transglycosylase domain-containing protein [Sphingobium jiangsuense]MBB3926355.1 hypothetical protein [Sphingobium jiangsuense]QEH80871.1 lytic transglycosylase domain-containing protein [Sphingomonas sp. C8-2]GLS99736.1 lytic transglycosylase [Sphingobium jiangsuense]